MTTPQQSDKPEEDKSQIPMTATQEQVSDPVKTQADAKSNEVQRS